MVRRVRKCQVGQKALSKLVGGDMHYGQGSMTDKDENECQDQTMETHELHIDELGECCWPLMGTRNLYKSHAPSQC